MIYIVDGKPYAHLKDVAKEYNMRPSTLCTRVRNGMSVDYAVKKPVRKIDMTYRNYKKAHKELQELTETPIVAVEKSVKDNINPNHYTYGKYECIDVLEDVLKDCKGVDAFCIGNAIKYLWRYNHKNGLEDLKKARWYLNRIINNIDNALKSN